MTQRTTLLERARRATAAGEHNESDAGFSLVELLVSMAVFSVIMGIAWTAVIKVQQDMSRVQGSAEAVSQLRAGLAQIDRQVRSGNVLYNPQNENMFLSSCSSIAANAGSCMRIYTQANALDKCVQWQVLPDPSAATTSILRTRSWDPTDTSPAPGGWTTVARGLVGNGVDPFTLRVGTALNPQYASRLLDISIAVRDPRQTSPVQVKSSLSGRNTSYGSLVLCDNVPLP